MQAATIDDLPDEILSCILLHVRQGVLPASFVSCLVCSRKWHRVALREHYRDIVLGVSGLGPFIAKFPREEGHMVKSLTIFVDLSVFLNDCDAMESPNDRGFRLQNGIGKVGEFWSQMQDLPGVIRTMTKLVTFSFVIGGEYERMFRLSSGLIAPVIKALPETCINLELDTRGHDAFGNGTHLCEPLAEIMPRLRHLRLRLYRFCPALLGPDFLYSKWDDQDTARSKTSRYPFLETVMINCIVGNTPWGESYLCTAFMDEQNYRVTGLEPDLSKPRLLVTRLLKELIHLSNFPSIKHLRILDFQEKGSPYQPSYSAYNRRDIIRDKTWTIPFHDLQKNEDGSVLCLLRTPEETEVLVEDWDVEYFAEGQFWKNTLSGARVPSAMLANQNDPVFEGQVEKALPVVSAAAYRALTPHITCHLWHNEEKTGMRLLSAFESDGVLEKHPVEELTPLGWRRHFYNTFSSSLERDGLVVMPLQ